MNNLPFQNQGLPQPSRSRLPAWFVLPALLALLVSACTRTPNATPADGVELLLGTVELESDTSLELRLPAPAIPATLIGRLATNSPIRIEPDLPGTFTWLSRRSGTFTPSEPLALGTRYRVWLRDGFTNVDGRPIAARLLRELQTPEFGIKGVGVGYWDTNDAPASFHVQVALNAAVEPAELARRASFRRPGTNIEATLVEPEPAEPGAVSMNLFRGGVDERTWRERFGLSRRTGRAAQQRTPDPVTDGPLRGMVTLTPARPLPPGENWELVIRPGLRSPEASKPIRDEHRHALGTVRPFEIRTIEARSALSEGRSIRLVFSKQLPPVDSAEDFRRWITVEPAPEKLSFHTAWSALAIHAAFKLDTDYVVRIAKGFPSAQGIELDSPVVSNQRFERLAPNLWFPAFETTQLARGSRTFPLHGVNVGKFRLRAKRLDENNLVHALRGYQRYTGRNGPAAPMDYDALAGRTVFEQGVPMPGELDEQAILTLRWDDLLGTGKPGPVFLAADLANPTNSNPWLPRPWLAGPQAIVQVTDLGLAWKSSADGIHAWNFSHHTGRGIAGARLRLVGRENEFLAEALTDAQGFARFAPSTNAVWLMASQGDDLHAASLSEGHIPLWSMGIPWRPGQGEDNGRRGETRIFFFTDRTLYRPGESVHMKGIVRTWAEDEWQVPAGAPVTLRWVDPRGDVQLTTNLTVSAAGSFHFTTTAPLRPRGSYSIQLRVAEAETSHSVRVADFQPAAFEVTIGNQPVYPPRQEIQLPVAARYFQGEPVRGARLRWQVEAEPAGFHPEGWDGFQFCVEDFSLRTHGYEAESVVAEGQDRPAAGTNTVLKLDLGKASVTAPQPFKARVLAEVSDLNDTTVTRAAEFVRHASAFYLGFRWRDGEESVLSPGVPLPFEVRAVAGDGSGFRGSVEATATLRHVTWNTVRTRTAGGALGYHSEASVTNVQELHLTLEPEHTGEVLLPPQENRRRSAAGARAQFAPLDSPGSYFVEIKAVDTDGNPVVTALPIGIGGDAKLAWNYRNGTHLDIQPDRTEYDAGETATLLIKAPFSGSAWVTVEREGVRRGFATELRGNAPVVRVPLESGDYPNVFISVMLVRGVETSSREFPTPEWRVGYAELKVRRPEDRLHVAVSTAPSEVRPGASTTAEIRVTAPDPNGGSGRAVADAEVTLYAVDEGVLALSGDTVPDPAAFFAEAHALKTETGISLGQILPENPALLEFHNKGALAGGGGDRGNHWREDFRPCALWLADAKTDADGVVRAPFQVPDSLTRFRVVAIATAGHGRFGNGTASLTVNKPAMLQPAAPSFAHVGDEIRLRALLFNRTTNVLESEVTLELDGLTSPAGAPRATNGTPTPTRLRQSVSVAPGRSTPVEFGVAFHLAGVATLRWSAFSATRPDANDRVVSTTSVGEVLPLERQVFSIRTEVAETNLLSLLDPRLLEGDSTLTLRISNSRLGELGECVDHLLHYPYGCVEQTSSSLLPWLLFSDARGLVPGIDPDSPRFTTAIAEGVSRLLGMQTASGGLSYWPGGRDPIYWGSAYGALVLGIARDHGVAVPEAPFKRLLDYLSTNLRSDTAGIPADRSAACLALYALARAGAAEPSWIDVLRREREQLGAENSALVALAALQSGTPPADLEAWMRAKPSTNSADGWFGGRARTAAVQLLLWSKFQRDPVETESRLEALMRLRRGGQWETTQGNAWALFALASQPTIGPVGGARRGQVIHASDRWPFRLAPTPSTVAHEFRLPAGAGAVPVLLANPEKQPLVVQGTLLSRAVGDPTAAAAVRRGFTLDRTYELLDDENQPAPAGNLRVGDRVLVTLRLTSSEAAEWVAIEDPIPAAFEIAKPYYDPPAAKPGTPTTPGAPRRAMWSGDFQEVRGDSIRYFRNDLPADEYIIQYVVRVRSAGSILAPPARIEAMYEPQRFAQTTATRLKIEARE